MIITQWVTPPAHVKMEVSLHNGCNTVDNDKGKKCNLCTDKVGLSFCQLFQVVSCRLNQTKYWCLASNSWSRVDCILIMGHQKVKVVAQLKAMLARNILLKRRQWKKTIAVTTPIIRKFLTSQINLFSEIHKDIAIYNM